MTSRAEVRFRGRVQGVHFREFTRRFSKRLGVKGWVKNMPDGSVEAVFEGESEAIEEVIRLLTEAHPNARVDHVDIIWLPPKNEFSTFEIR